MTHPPRTLAAVVSTALTAGMLTACAGATSGNTTNTITYLDSAPYTGLYPPTAGYYPNGGIVNNITDRLLYQDPNTLELHPWIATELPEINADATEFTFNIRTDVTYSDGSKLTAANVVHNFDLYGGGDKTRKLTASEQISNYDRGEVIDEDTVRFHFKKPAPGFPQATSTMNAGLLADSTLAADLDGYGPGNATTIIGSGPFVITGEDVGTKLTLTARDDYNWAPPALPHQGRPAIDGIEWIVAPEASVRAGALIADQADVARQIDGPVERQLRQRGVGIFTARTNGVNNGLDLRFRHPLLQDIRVREAIAGAVNRDDIVDKLFTDSYPAATSVLAKNAPGYQDNSAKLRYDPERSKELLDEAGWQPAKDGIRVKDGQRLSLGINHANVQPRSREIVTMLQQQLAAIGIELQLLPGDRAAQNAAIKDINKVQVHHSMVARADLDVIKSEFAGDNRNSLLNVAKDKSVGDEKLAELLDKVAITTDNGERAALVGTIQRHLLDDFYSVPILEEPQMFGVNPRVEGFYTEPVGRPTFYQTKVVNQHND
ncbi:TIGR04028 family ABC transporter substrate-binding protein [Corynebacterium ulceribovis]|uniref:TIGR04028 family ABC transporter substrate-binding protein n=1 Tax=Corynebacterium ulceribovis TaxID=487732 RepID=UPI00036B28BE|nr:TIGR04028 family ABC transporter substrate-binding protein [Corynebacterium ulceribovis]